MSLSHKILNFESKKFASYWNGCNKIILVNHNLRYIFFIFFYNFLNFRKWEKYIKSYTDWLLKSPGRYRLDPCGWYRSTAPHHNLWSVHNQARIGTDRYNQPNSWRAEQQVTSAGTAWQTHLRTPIFGGEDSAHHPTRACSSCKVPRLVARARPLRRSALLCSNMGKVWLLDHIAWTLGAHCLRTPTDRVASASTGHVAPSRCCIWYSEMCKRGITFWFPTKIGESRVFQICPLHRIYWSASFGTEELWMDFGGFGCY
jgi:hypothetical protein